MINSSSRKLADTDFDVCDVTAHVCPVGAILVKYEGFDVPIGQCLYDRQPINMVGDVAQEARGGTDHGE